MPQGIDHIVIAVRDLAEASTDYAAAGFTVSPGGEHVGGATHNALVSFADGAYFELIALKDHSNAGEHRWFAALEKGDGTVAYAVRAVTLTAEIDRLRAGGLEVNGPRDGGRVRPDGQEVAWRTITLNGGTPGGALPFLIEDVTARNVRVPDGEATRHALDVLGVAGVTVVTGDFTASTAAYTALFGEGSPSPELARGAIRQTRFQTASHWIDLAEPEAGSALAATQNERGDGVVLIALTGPTNSDLPRDLTHGVQIRIDAAS